MRRSKIMVSPLFTGREKGCDCRIRLTLLSSWPFPCGTAHELTTGARLRDGASRRALALAHDPRLLAEDARPLRRLRAEGPRAGGFSRFPDPSPRARLRRRQHHRSAQG